MKKIKRFNESIINNNLTNISQDIIDYLETWPDEYDDLKFKFVDIKTIIPSVKKGLIIQVEYILPEILWGNQYNSRNVLSPTQGLIKIPLVKDINYVENQIIIWNRLKTLFTRLEVLGGVDIKYKDATFLSQRPRSISIDVFISSDTP